MEDESGNSYNLDLDRFIEQLRKCEYIQDDRAVKTLCDKAKELLAKDENVIYLSTPITVITFKYLQKYCSISYFRYVEIFMVNFMI